METINYSVDLKKDLVTQFTEQPKLDALLTVIQKQFEDLAKFMLQLRVERWLEEAQGTQLDGIGDIVCLTRGEAGYLACLDKPNYVLTDDEYRKFLIFKIWKNTSICTYHDVIKVFKMFWGKPLHYSEDPSKPATMLFETDVMKPFEMDVEELFKVPIVRAAGVGIYITAITQSDPIEYELHADSHLGGNLTVTPVPEYVPDWGFDDEVYLSEAMPRWEQSFILDDQTPTGIVVYPDYANRVLRIYGYLQILGNHDLTVLEDPDELSLNVACEGPTVTTNKTMLVITGG